MNRVRIEPYLTYCTCTCDCLGDFVFITLKEYLKEQFE